MVGVIPDPGPHLGLDLIHIAKNLVDCVHSLVSLDGIIDPHYCALVTSISLTKAVVTISVLDI